MIDNLMDLTHETYVHADQHRPEGDRRDAGRRRRSKATTSITSRFMERHHGAAVLAHGAARQQPGRRRAGRPLADLPLHAAQPRADRGRRRARRQRRLRRRPDVKASSIVVDFITPETETSIWYFWGMARNFNPHDKALTAQHPRRPGQDLQPRTWQMLEAQQRNLLAAARAPICCSLNIDSGGVQARRVLERIIAHEQARRSGACYGGRDGRSGADTDERFRPAGPSRRARRRRPSTSATFELVNVDERPLPAFSAGSHIDVHLPSGLTRQYSLCNDPTRGPPLPDRRAARPGLARRLAGDARADEGRRRAAHQRAAGTTSRSRTRRRTACCWPAASASRRSCAWPSGWPSSARRSRCTTARARRSAPRSASASRASSFASRVQFHFDDGPRSQKLRLEPRCWPRCARACICTSAARRASWTAVLGAARASGLAADQAALRVLRAPTSAATGTDGELRGQAREHGASGRRAEGQDRRPGARRGRRRGADLVRAGRVRHLPDARARRRAGSRDMYLTPRGAGGERSVHAVLLEGEVGAAGVGSVN